MNEFGFHTVDGHAMVRGREFHDLEVMIVQMGLGQTGIGCKHASHSFEQWRDLLSPSPETFEGRAWQSSIVEWFGGCWHGSLALLAYSPLAWRGRELDVLELSLNTALRLGSDPVRLGARLIGQASLHAWVDGSDRAWLAGIIAQSLESGVFHAGIGWDEVIDLLTASALGPVVTGRSGPFPESWLHQEIEDPAERWQLALAELQADTAGRLQIRPGDFATFRFGAGLDVLDLADPTDRTARLDAAYPQILEASL